MMSNNGTTLHTFCKDGVSLADALNAWKQQLANAMGLIYSAKKCLVLALDDVINASALRAKMERPPFEARVFNKDYELRWVATAESFDANGDANMGTAVVLSEESDAVVGWMDASQDYIQRKDADYILWGKVHNDNAVTFFDHRMDKLHIPAAAFGTKPSGDREYGTIKACEYLAVDDEDGNCAVVAERLRGWGVAKSREA